MKTAFNIWTVNTFFCLFVLSPLLCSQAGSSRACKACVLPIIFAGRESGPEWLSFRSLHRVVFLFWLSLCGALELCWCCSWCTALCCGLRTVYYLFVLDRQRQHISQLEQKVRESELQVHSALLGCPAPYGDVYMLRMQVTGGSRVPVRNTY